MVISFLTLNKNSGTLTWQGSYSFFFVSLTTKVQLLGLAFVKDTITSLKSYELCVEVSCQASSKLYIYPTRYDVQHFGKRCWRHFI